MKNYLLSALIGLSSTLNAQITKVEHFFVSSPNAESLFNLLKNDLGLPVVWDYESWGDFSSGGITLGNVAFEFVGSNGATKTAFEGIALEPRQHMDELIVRLDELKIEHGKVVVTKFDLGDGTVAGWSTMSLPHLLPDEAGLFICDYTLRDRVFLNRKKPSDTLKSHRGGPLGVISLKEIVVGSTDLASHKKELARLPGIKAEAGDVFNFEQGPAIRLKSSATNRTEKIVIRVHSVKKAGEFLKSKDLLGESTKDGLTISPKAVEGLKIELVER